MSEVVILPADWRRRKSKIEISSKLSASKLFVLKVGKHNLAYYK